MPIYVPGKRDRHNKTGGTKRKMVAVLSLTAMVDMFTVLVVFLLQNLNATGEIIEIPDNVKLPQASTVKEIAPSNVLIISTEKVIFNDENIYDVAYVKEQENWTLLELKKYVRRTIADAAKKSKEQKVAKSEPEKVESKEPQIEHYLKMTLQADEDVDFLTVKKVMYTLTEAGIQQINFAVLKKERPSEEL